MIATQKKFLDVIGEPAVQFVVPIFQRVYSWTQPQCKTLFDDVLAAGHSGQEHFAGTFLYTVEKDDAPAHVIDGVGTDSTYWRLQIVDGQQRLTTVTLMLIALSDHLRKTGQTLADGTDALTIAQRYLFAGSEGASVKLALTSIDRDMLEHLLGASDEPEDISSQLKENLEFFSSKMSKKEFDSELFWRGLNLLTVISIELDEKDSAQAVFENLNSKGKRLNIEDMIRNVILVESGWGKESADSVVSDGTNLAAFEQIWEPLEDAVYALDDATMDDMVCCWLESMYGDMRINSEDEIFQVFNKMIDTRYRGSYIAMLRDLDSYCRSLIANVEQRKEALRAAKKWRTGKARGLISNMKLFGD